MVVTQPGHLTDREIMWEPGFFNTHTNAHDTQTVNFQVVLAGECLGISGSLLLREADLLLFLVRRRIGQHPDGSLFVWRWEKNPKTKPHKVFIPDENNRRGPKNLKEIKRANERWLTLAVD